MLYFCNDPKLFHERAINRIVKYLIGSSSKGIIYKLDKEKGVEFFVDTYFSGAWDSSDPSNPENIMSRTGYTIMYAECPVLWVSCLQTEIALIKTESEYTALSQSMRDVNPLMSLLNEIVLVFLIYRPKTKVQYTVFEDNTSCITVDKAPNMTTRTNHIPLKYHHFRSFVQREIIDIKYINTKEQTADIFSKPVNKITFLYLRKKLCG